MTIAVYVLQKYASDAMRTGVDDGGLKSAVALPKVDRGVSGSDSGNDKIEMSVAVKIPATLIALGNVGRCRPRLFQSEMALTVAQHFDQEIVQTIRDDDIQCAIAIEIGNAHFREISRVVESVRWQLGRYCRLKGTLFRFPT